jgi:hypothetical protein
MPRTAAVTSCRFFCSALRQHTWYTHKLAASASAEGNPPKRTRMRTELVHHHPLALDLPGSGVLSLCRVPVSFHPCFYRHRARFRHQYRYSRPNTIDTEHGFDTSTGTAGPIQSIPSTVSTPVPVQQAQYNRYRARFRHQYRYSRPNTIQRAWHSESGVSLRRQQQPGLRRDERQPASSRCPSGRCAQKS